MSDIQVLKRDGTKEQLNLDKVHKMVEFACEGLAGVSASQVEIQSGLQFCDGITSNDIQEILIRSASDLITEENPNYQYVAARLLLFGLRKAVHGHPEILPPLLEHVKGCIDKGVYDSAIVNRYSEEEWDRINSFVDHERDYLFTYAGLRQVVDKYLVQDRSTGKHYESPQQMYIMIAATLFANYPTETRLDYVRRYYNAISTHKINIPTPIMGGVRTPIRQFASCVLVDIDDTLDSIFSSDMAIGKYVAQRAGIGINAGRIRGIKRHDVSHSAERDQIECITKIGLFNALCTKPTSVAKCCAHSTQHVKHDPHSGQRFTRKLTVPLIGVHDDICDGQ